MILELGDGRELQLPDEMPDETARQLKRWILTLEERAATAESESRLLRDEMAALRSHVITAPPAQDDGVAAAISAMRDELGRGLRQVAALAGADRMIIYAEDGSPRSRIVR